MSIGPEKLIITLGWLSFMVLGLNFWLAVHIETVSCLKALDYKTSIYGR